MAVTFAEEESLAAPTDCAFTETAPYILSAILSYPSTVVAARIFVEVEIILSSSNVFRLLFE